MALREGSNRSIDIILNFMSKIYTNSSRSFRSIFHDLVEYNKLKTYLDEMPVHTMQMEKKQVLKIPTPLSKEIVAMKESPTIYIDRDFYVGQMGERPNDTSCSSYPVRVVALRIGWMLHSEDGFDGRQFL